MNKQMLPFVESFLINDCLSVMFCIVKLRFTVVTARH